MRGFLSSIESHLTTSMNLILQKLMYLVTLKWFVIYPYACLLVAQPFKIEAYNRAFNMSQAIYSTASKSLYYVDISLKAISIITPYYNPLYSKVKILYTSQALFLEVWSSNHLNLRRPSMWKIHQKASPRDLFGHLRVDKCLRPIKVDVTIHQYGNWSTSAGWSC